MSKRLTAGVTRPTRTAVQGGLAYGLVELADAFGADFTGRQYAAVLLVLTIVLSSVQAFIENRVGAGFLRDVPPKTDPIVDTPDAGHTDVVTVVSVIALMVLLLWLIGALPGPR